jgi:cysteine-rich repeat protein
MMKQALIFLLALQLAAYGCAPEKRDLPGAEDGDELDAVEGDGEDQVDADGEGEPDGEVEPDGEGDPDADADEDVEEDEIGPVCGNSAIEEGEECDDGRNGDPDDGCTDACLYSCHASSECMDADVCNGDETCGPSTHRCEAGTPREDGFVCAPGDPRMICLSQICVESACGDGFVDTGNGEDCEPPAAGSCNAECKLTCTGDTDCPDDLNVCNGNEYCNLGTNLCDRRDPLSDGTSCGTSPRMICLAQSCQASRCGDGYVDAGQDPAEECEDGNIVTDDGCEPDTCRYSCHADPDCDDGHDCTDDHCDSTTTHACQASTVSGTATVCRVGAGTCDSPETCDGTNQDCPADAFLPSTTECRPAAGQCDVAESCTGTSADCPVNAFRPVGYTCDDANPYTHDDVCTASGLCIGTPSGLTGVVSVSVGNYHTCAHMSTNGAKCWGRNSGGQLGDWTTTDRSVPDDVWGGIVGVIDISAGGYHSCALMDTGGVMCWGSNSYGQIGDGTTTGRLTPVDVSGLTSGVMAVSAGGSHTCALTTSGGVKCWGQNDNGQLGDGTTTQQTTPVDVSGLTSGVTAISAGGTHTCALMTGGGVKCWGYNNQGQLGDGTYARSSIPVDVSGLTSGVSAVSLGYYYTCALTTGGGVKCWGDNSVGQLGDGTNTDRNTPVDVTGLASGVTKVSAGGGHACVVTSGGGVKCWGDNTYGELGDRTTVQRTSPVDVVSLSSGVADLDAGGYAYYSSTGTNGGHTCALLAAGSLECWGRNDSGQLGDATTITRTAPVDVTGLAVGMSDVSVGGNHACALTTGGGVKCQGWNEYGQLGDGSVLIPSAAVDVTGLASGVASISIGMNHSCAVTTAGGAQCWGYNNYGQIGNGTTTNRTAPTDVFGLTTGVLQVSAGGSHTCAVTTTGGAKCWGYNVNGQLGDGTTMNRITARDVVGLTSGVVAVEAGASHTCALLDTGGVKCWGNNSNYQLGDGTNTNASSPVDVSGLTSGVAAISAGGSHTCALMDTGGLKCWGNNGNGQVGDGSYVMYRATPVDVSGLTSGVAAVSAGGSHTCALLTVGAARCWGINTYGQVGNGGSMDSHSPAIVTGLSADVAAVSAGFVSSCAVMAVGNVKCWGYDRYGQTTGFFNGYPHPVVSL